MGRRTGIPPKVGPLRVGQREKGPVRVGTITKGVTDKENTREEKNAPQACTTHPQGMANLAISWVVMRFRWPKQRIGGLNKASLTLAQPAPNHFEAHKNGAKRASQQLACLAPVTTAAGTEPSEASRPRRGRFALQRNPEGGVPLHCNRLRL